MPSLNHVHNCYLIIDSIEPKLVTEHGSEGWTIQYKLTLCSLKRISYQTESLRKVKEMQNYPNYPKLSNNQGIRKKKTLNCM